MGFFKSIKRVATGVATGGISEFASKNPFGVPRDIALTGGAVALGTATGNPMAGAQLGLSMFSGLQAAQAQRDANEANIAMAREQMSFSAQQAKQQQDFQERMSSTAVQRAVADMKAAGINPMLAAGAGESSPGGAMGSSAGARVDPVTPASMGLASTAKELIGILQNVQESNSRISLNKEQAGLTKNKASEAAADAFIAQMKMRVIKRYFSDAKDVFNTMENRAKDKWNMLRAYKENAANMSNEELLYNMGR